MVELVVVWGQPGLHSELQDSQDFLMKPHTSSIFSFYNRLYLHSPVWPATQALVFPVMGLQMYVTKSNSKMAHLNFYVYNFYFPNFFSCLSIRSF